MTYVISDLHGYPLKHLKEALQKVEFGAEDHLYVLGDCIDRGKEGVDLLLYCMNHPNITFILGNHEAMLLDNRFLFEGDTVPTVWDLVGNQRYLYAHWTSNGGYTTLQDLEIRNRKQVQWILEYLEEAPLYKELYVNGKRYVLTHGGLGNFDESKPLNEYTLRELVWERPSFCTTYYQDGTMVIFGHTPTQHYGSEYKGKPIITDTWMDIDVGASVGMPPLLLRLEDGAQTYL